MVARMMLPWPVSRNLSKIGLWYHSFAPVAVKVFSSVVSLWRTLSGEISRVR